MDYGLIGEHLSHSYSKLIQEKLLDNYHYDLQEIAKEKLDEFMTSKEFKAINVTIPYKKSVIPYLTEMDYAAKQIGAVNTIVNRDGQLFGYNTDYYGFKYMVTKHSVSFENKKVAVLGNGGASQAIQAVVKDLNAKEMLVTDLILSDGIISMDELTQNHSDVEIIINTTPMGMYPKVHGSAIDLVAFPNCQAVFDCVYNPQDTAFTLQAKSLGIKTAVTGLEMLVGQAKKALEHFKDIEIDDSEIDRIYREILSETSNCVLINADEQTAKKCASAMKKNFVNLNDLDDIESFCISSNQVLLANSEMDHTTLIRNGFIVSSSEYSLIIEEYKSAISQFNI
ncbi:shikimate dehydrogenase family protein [Floccifex sp.]|uniref:shikimate dehydrogenase family protein n=1 Tax=Floccifex sp. TaxID=2815810 RepID=UPI003F0DFB88